MSSNQASSPTNVAAPSKTGGYIPGVCNINSAEIAYRRKSGYVLLAISVALTAPLVIFSLPHWIRLLLFFPFFLTTVCFLQVKYKFCVSYGAAGKQNAVEGDKVAQEIVDAAARKLDRARTRNINSQAAVIGLILAVVVAIIP